jgi:large subunit ribosomal protein L22
MPKWGYSVTDLNPEKTAKISGRDLRVSLKNAKEVCKTIKGMKLEEAKTLLRQVMDKEKAVPFRRYKKKAAHRRGLQKAYAGKYPIKAAKGILRLLEGAEANAEFKGLDTERLKIIHAAASPSMKMRDYIPRAFGRSSPYFDTLTHVELVLEQIEAP